MDKTPLVGVVTVLYNSSSVLDDFYKSIANQIYNNFILYIIDNRSLDDSLIKCKELQVKYSKVKSIIIENVSNLGIAEGNNIGIQRSIRDKCEYVLLLNNDTIFDSSLFSEIINGSIHYNADMLVPKIKFYGTNKIWCAGGTFNWLKCTTIHYGYLKEDLGQFEKSMEVLYSPTCCMLIHVSVFESIGLMNNKYFVYFDDTDFVYRAIKKHFKLRYFPTSPLYHKESTSTGINSPFKTYYLNRNQFLFLRYNFSKLYMLYIFIYRIIVHYLIHYFTMNKELYRSEFRGLLDGVKLSI